MPALTQSDASLEVPFQVGETITVAPRTWPGMNKLGGTGRITKVHKEGTCVT